MRKKVDKKKMPEKGEGNLRVRVFLIFPRPLV